MSWLCFYLRAVGLYCITIYNEISTAAYEAHPYVPCTVHSLRACCGIGLKMRGRLFATCKIDMQYLFRELSKQMLPGKCIVYRSGMKTLPQMPEKSEVLKRVAWEQDYIVAEIHR